MSTELKIERTGSQSVLLLTLDFNDGRVGSVLLSKEDVGSVREHLTARIDGAKGVKDLTVKVQEAL